MLWTGVAADEFRAVQDRDVQEDVLAVPLGAEWQGREKAEVAGNIATPHSA